MAIRGSLSSLQKFEKSLEIQAEITGKCADSSSNMERKVSELCVCSNEFKVKLVELNILVVKYDGELLKKIVEDYHAVRGSELRNILLKPVDVDIVLVSVSMSLSLHPY
jgi:hypothetical protein